MRMIGPAFTKSCGLAYDAKLSSNKGSQKISFIALNADANSSSNSPNIIPPKSIVRKTAIRGVVTAQARETFLRFSSLSMAIKI